MKVQIKKVYISDKKKSGEPLQFTNKQGQIVSYQRVAILTDQTGEEWRSAMVTKSDDPVLNLKEGDTLDLTFYEKNGFKNFRMSTNEDMMKIEIEAIKKRLDALEGNDSLEDDYKKIGGTIT